VKPYVASDTLGLDVIAGVFALHEQAVNEDRINLLWVQNGCGFAHRFVSCLFVGNVQFEPQWLTITTSQNITLYPYMSRFCRTHENPAKAGLVLYGGSDGGEPVSRKVFNIHLQRVVCFGDLSRKRIKQTKSFSTELL